MEVMITDDREERERPPAPPGPVPWLVYPCGEGGNDHVFCTITSSSTTSQHHNIIITGERKSIPELRTCKLLSCFHGWSLLFNSLDDFLLLWNPVTLESINLPPFSYTPDIHATIFTASPKQPGCTVLLFKINEPVVTYFKVGDEQWTTHNYGADIGQLLNNNNNNESFTYEDNTFDSAVTCLDGVVYAFTDHDHERHMVAIEVDDERRFNIKSLGISMPKGTQFSEGVNRYMLTYMGEIYEVDMNTRGYCIATDAVGFQVFRLDFSKKAWFKVHKLNDWSIVLGNFFDMSCVLGVPSSQFSIEGNKIYYTRIRDVLLYTYDLHHGGILASFPCSSTLGPPWFTPMWVAPDPCFADDHVKLEVIKVLKDVEAEEDSTIEFPFLHLDIFDEDDEQWPYHYLDMFTSIARHLELQDYLQFRAACRFFRLAAPIKWREACISMERKIPRPSFISLEAKVPYPLLVTFISDRTECTLTDPKHHEKYSMKIPESLLETSVLCSKDGYLLLIGADGKSLSFFNPFTREQRQLPMLSSIPTSFGFTFSSLPSCSQFLVLEIDYTTDGTRIEISYCRPNQDNKWHEVEFDNEVMFFPNGNSPVFYERMFYALSFKGKLGVLKFDDDDGDKLRWEVLTKPESPCEDFHHGYLVECDKELLAVFVDRSRMAWIKVFRLDGSKMEWVSVTTLGRYAIFVSHTSAFTTVARSSDMENKIYLPRFHGQRIVYYSLETGKFHSHGRGTVELSNFCYTTKQLYSCWIQPIGVSLDGSIRSAY